ncbi:unnamed protein product [Vitrella brassicaformis CCMP3155]|uniref:Uncharacterized protein n=1 Tax=Vitrella brassicaformis (strain CCMP3155) TaxID=1169540 RepID=A0A0G4GF31_VITBC|nr:unnamed protein product [Vitrella brassicaformis CCMP3155]|eukprot:CEM28119.1 unnamed protein product [Vitrella brassicaformis CCMP3155]
MALTFRHSVLTSRITACAGQRFVGPWMLENPLARNLTFTAALAVFSVFAHYGVDEPMRAFLNLGKRGHK